MGAIGGLLGLNGGISGTGINMQTPTNFNQLQGTYENSEGSIHNQEALLKALQAQGPNANQAQVYNQLQGVATGQGPNPAQAMLNQSTGQNVANQAALMAGQRGAGANVGLMARQAAQQGAGLQQQAIGQGATMQANQQLGALGQAGNIAGQQAQNQLAQNQLLMSGANAIAGQNLGEQQILQNANSSYNQVQGGLAGKTMEGQQGLIGGVLGGAGAAIGLADGGEVPDDGASDDSSSSFGKYFANMGMGKGNPMQSGMASFVGGLGHQLGKVPGMLAPGPMMAGVPSSAMQPMSGPNLMGAYAKGGNVDQKLKAGGDVPGKAKVSGNSPKNDTVKAALSPGEGVIDRETMDHPGQVGDMARFVMAYVNHKKRGK